MSTSILGAQCSLAVELGEDQEVCSNRRDIVLQSSIDGIPLHFTWDPTEKVDNPFSLNPKALAGRADEISYSLTVSGYHPNDNLIRNGNFELGDTLFTSQYEASSTSSGGYLVDTIGTSLFSDAKPCRDHSSGFGLMMLAKISDASDVPIWCQEVTIEANQMYHFDGVATGLRTNLPPVLVLKINDEVISSGTLGSFACSWQTIQGDWFSGNARTAQVCIHVSPEDIGKNTDFALDDLGFYPVCEVTDQMNYTSRPLEIVGPEKVELVCGQEIQINTSLIGPSRDVLYRWRTRGGNFQSDVYSSGVTINMGGIYELGAAWTNNVITCWDTLRIEVDAVIEEDLELLQNSVGTCDDPLVEVRLNRELTLPHLRYNWTSEGADIVPVQRDRVEATSAGVFSLHIEDTVRQCDWQQSISVFIDALDAPTFTIGDLNCVTGGRDLIVDDPGGSLSYSINGDDFQDMPIFSDLSTGSYELWVRNQEGCLGRDSVRLAAASPVKISLADRIFIEEGAGTLPTETNIDQAQINEIAWTPSQFLSCSDCLNPIVMIDEPTDFSIRVLDENGCRDSAMVTVVAVSDQPLFLPNAFSPNGDGINDYLRPTFGTRVQAILDLKVFDRWGTLVFEASGNAAERGWSGVLNTSMAPAGSYVYAVQYLGADQKERYVVGSALLIR